MRRAFIVCTVGLLFALTTSADAATQGEYYRPHYRSCGYYRYVCRAWWGACRWEGPYLISIPGWGMRYFCF
jgi:hypothetical protein